MRPELASAAAIAGSVVVYAAACQVGSRSPSPLDPLRRRRFWPLLAQLAQFVYYVGIPYWAVREGIAQARMMGLDGWGGVADASISVGLAAAAFVVLSFGWRSQARLGRTLGGSTAGGAVLAPPSAHWSDALLQAVYLEAHWAFYRSGPILWLGGDYYTGSCLGFGLICFECLLNPEIRAGLRRRDGSSFAVAADWSLALCMTVGFFFSHNLALMTVLHWWVELGLRRVRRALATRFPPVGAAETILPR